MEAVEETERQIDNVLVRAEERAYHEPLLSPVCGCADLRNGSV